MKTRITQFIAVIAIAATLSSCATIFGGSVSECQRTKPAPGEPERSVRVVALVADFIIFWPGAVVDFATGAIYKPCNK